jgi:threonine synthase
MDTAFLECINPDCQAKLDITSTLVGCPHCHSLLDVNYDWDKLFVPNSLTWFETRWRDRREPLAFSGVWRFRELFPFASEDHIMTIGEGQTLLGTSERAARFAQLDPNRFWLQYEGLNPSGSFKDNGMTAAFTHARMVGAQKAACASTGNTSASLAMYGAAFPFMEAVVFIGQGNIAAGKLAQALDHGALTLRIEGNFDDALCRVREAADRLGIYLVNSVNAFRLEGQKSIMYRVLESLRWEPPDWIVVPGGNLGNTSAFGKAFAELHRLNLIQRIPRLAVINAAGAATFHRLVHDEKICWNRGRWNRPCVERFYADLDSRGEKPSTLASAIEINRPVNFPKALRALEVCRGVVCQVSDEEILDAKAVIGAGGLGCEPASAASLAGAKLLREQGVIAPSDRVVCILTGHLLKDPTVPFVYHAADADTRAEQFGRRGVQHLSFSNPPISVANDLDTIVEALKKPRL